LMSSAAATADETGAPALDKTQAGHYRVKVGSADVVALPDHVSEHPNPASEERVKGGHFG